MRFNFILLEKEKLVEDLDPRGRPACMLRGGAR